MGLAIRIPILIALVIGMGFVGQEDYNNGVDFNNQNQERAR